MKLFVLKDHQEIGLWTAKYLSQKIKNFSPSFKKKYFVLGLPTGSTPLPVYQSLIKMYKNGEVSFENVVTFNMDEYVGLNANHKESYYHFMYDNFFNHINIKKENINILNGNKKKLQKECEDFEEKINKVNGVDLFLGGVGVNGHIAFNEPGSSILSKTRIVQLDDSTIKANSKFFENKNLVPKKALSVGISTILLAKEILILANGEKKKKAVRNAVLGEVSKKNPISFLKLHQNFTLVCDKDSACLLDNETKSYFTKI